MELEEVLEGKRMSSLKLKMISGGSMLLPTENQIRVYWIMRGRGSWSLNAWSWKRCWRGKDMLIQRLRKKSLSKEVSKKAFTEVDEFGRPVLKETHQIAEAQKEKNKQLKEAFGISEYFVEGSSFDPNRRALEEAARDGGGRKKMGLDNEEREEKRDKKKKKKKKVVSSDSESENSEEEKRKRKDRKKNKKKSKSRSVERHRRERSDNEPTRIRRGSVDQERRENRSSPEKQRREKRRSRESGDEISQDRSKGRNSNQDRDKRRISGNREGSVRIKYERGSERTEIQWETNKGTRRADKDRSSRREEDEGERGDRMVVKEEPESPVRRARSGERRHRRDSSGRKQREESADRIQLRGSEERDREGRGRRHSPVEIKQEKSLDEGRRRN